MSVIELTTGVPGCGKTYVRAARFLVDDFLINSQGRHISNFPLKPLVIAETVSRKINSQIGFFGLKRKKVTPEDIASRIEIIPDDVLQAWRHEQSGPWEYFKGVDLRYCHIAIDEIHNFLSLNSSPQYVKLWDDFLGEVRHRGCTFEGLTQDIDQVPKELQGRASIRLELVPAEDLRDPYFHIKMLDWYELKAGFTGSFHKTVFLFEKRKQGKSWKTNNISRFLITPEYFQFYDSFNASLQEKESGTPDASRSLEYEYQRRGKISLLFWFFRRNWLTVLIRFLIAGLVMWLCFFGGLSFLIQRWLDTSKQISKSNSVSVQRKKDPIKSNSDSVSGEGNSFSEKSASDPKVSERVETVQEQKDRQKKIEECVRSWKPAMFFDGRCWTRGGVEISLNYKINEKDCPYDGKTVKEIDFKKRLYILDDDTRIDMY